MSTSIVADIYADMQALPIDLKIMHFIDRHGNIWGQNCYKSYAQIADAVGVTRRYVIERCKVLEQKCQLRITRRRDPAKVHRYHRAKQRGEEPKEKHLNLINCFSLVRKWMKELSYQEIYMAKQRRQLAQQNGTAHLSSELGSSPKEKSKETIERTHNPETSFHTKMKQESCTHPPELCSKFGDVTICLHCYAQLPNEEGSCGNESTKSMAIRGGSQGRT
jgi:hypothetical protein